MSLMSRTSGHMAQVICTEMLEAAAISVKNVIKHSIVQRLKNSVPYFTQNTVLCYNEQSIDKCYWREQMPLRVSYKTRKYTMQAKRTALYVMAGRVHAQTSALKG
jgi:spermidine/putrescine-binding protein